MEASLLSEASAQDDAPAIVTSPKFKETIGTQIEAVCFCLMLKQLESAHHYMSSMWIFPVYASFEAVL